MSALSGCLLVVDDEFIIAQGLKAQVEELGMEVCGATASADDAIVLAVRHRATIVLMDMRLQGERDGVDAALTIHALVGSKMIFITGSREPATMARIQLDHPFAVLFRPISDGQLRTAIAAAMESLASAGPRPESQ
jgi:two-component system, response regulator PdtaR